jgi:alginate O-acetyltransferase complex protein AlgI
MLFNSYEFLFVFLPVTLVGYYSIGTRSHTAALVWLGLASIAFYASGAQANLTLIVASIAINYFVALRIARAKGRRRYLLAAGCVAINVGLIAYFKYAGLLVSTANGMTGVELPLPTIVLPLGISFWTFQKIAYIVDVHKAGGPIRSLPRYIVFVLFFPQLIAGPIVHHKEIVPQLTPELTSRIEWTNLAVGLSIFSIGLAKKMLFADTIAVFATPVFRAAEDGVLLTTTEAWTGALAYAFQIYFDFSGYSDMAIGIGRMFGIRLPLNFDSPYKSANIIEFWRRWHMTLSRFLRDYVYIPLGGNRFGRVDRYTNVLLTMLIGGLWHGAAWTFLVWGGLHGLYLVTNHAFRAVSQRPGFPHLLPSAAARWLGRVVTFVVVVLAWVFFRAESWGAARNMLHAMFPPRDFAFSNHVVNSPAIAWLLLSGLLIVAWFAPNTQTIMRDYEPALGWRLREPVSAFMPIVWRPSPPWALAIGLVLAACILSRSEATEFIYFNF